MGLVIKPIMISLLAAVATMASVAISGVWAARSYVEAQADTVRDECMAELRRHHDHHVSRGEFDASIKMIIRQLDSIERKLDVFSQTKKQP